MSTTTDTETIEEKMARLERDNAWLKGQLAAAERTLALKHIPMPTEEQEDGEDPEHWNYAGLVAKYCALLRRNDEYTDGRADLLARLFLKEMAHGARFTVSEGAAADAVIRADKRIRGLKALLGKAEADVSVYKMARERDMDHIDELTARIAELTVRIAELERPAGTAEGSAATAAPAGGGCADVSPFEALFSGGGDLASLHFAQSLLGGGGK